MLIKFKDIQIGQTVLKSGSFPSGKVLEVKRYEGTGYSEGELYRLSLDNGDQWYGWAERFVKIAE